MLKRLATTTIVGALALAAFCLPAAATSSSLDNGVPNGAVQTASTEDVSARTRRRNVRRYRAIRVYPAPTHYYGYYGPRYYERPNYRPAPFFFGLGGYW